MMADVYVRPGHTPQIPAQIAAVVDLGFTSVSLNLAAVARASMTAGLSETIDGFAAVVDQIR